MVNAIVSRYNTYSICFRFNKTKVMITTTANRTPAPHPAMIILLLSLKMSTIVNIYFVCVYILSFMCVQSAKQEHDGYAICTDNKLIVLCAIEI